MQSVATLTIVYNAYNTIFQLISLILQLIQLILVSVSVSVEDHNLKRWNRNRIAGGLLATEENRSITYNIE